MENSVCKQCINIETRHTLQIIAQCHQVITFHSEIRNTSWEADVRELPLFRDQPQLQSCLK